jgi:hypothetical protein
VRYLLHRKRSEWFQSIRGVIEILYFDRVRAHIHIVLDLGNLTLKANKKWSTI